MKKIKSIKTIGVPRYLYHATISRFWVEIATASEGERIKRANQGF